LPAKILLEPAIAHAAPNPRLAHFERLRITAGHALTHIVSTSASLLLGFGSNTASARSRSKTFSLNAYIFARAD
jgi:hypothetical protein